MSKNKFPKTSELIRKKRAQSGVPQSLISFECGYASPQFISNWERGVSRPPLNTLPILMSMLGITKTEILKAYLGDDKAILEAHLRSQK